MSLLKRHFVWMLVAVVGVVHADELVVNAPDGEVNRERGVAAWARIYNVVSHPRCANCHVDASNVPMWTGPSYGKPRPHGMNIAAGASRVGAETVPCTSCHITSRAPNSTPHAAPHAGHPWMLAPVEFVWFGKDSVSICEQMRDPSRNGGRDGDGLVQHVLHDAEQHAFITWSFSPGGGREPAPGTLQQHLNDMVVWTAAGMPCPQPETVAGAESD
ncbi:MAG: hypothetical protein AAFM91_17295 [Pseudomonadota bacterium]